jgi:hypothetical protein
MDWLSACPYTQVRHSGMDCPNPDYRDVLGSSSIALNSAIALSLDHPCGSIAPTSCIPAVDPLPGGYDDICV